ncbi:MAG: ABC transporter substrate-binding protein [Desulfosalsimonas sp.]
MHSKNAGIIIVLVCLALAFAVIFYRFAAQQNPDAQRTGSRLVLAHDKGNMPLFDQSFSRQGKKAQSEISTGFIPVASAGTDLYISQMKARLPTSRAPALFTWWSAWRVKELVDKDLVSDLTHIWDRYADEYPQEIRDAYTIDGKVYGFPYSVEYWPIWYNKPLFEKLGIKEPETWEEFMAACRKLKAASVPPVAASLQMKWYACMWFAALVMGEDPLLYEQLCNGEVRYTDARVKKAMTIWADMIGKGYFTEPSLNLFTNGGHLWNNDAFGMVLCGSWYYSTILRRQGVKKADIGVFILPPHNPAAQKSIMMESGPVLTAANSPHRKQAEAIADWWMSEQGSRDFAKTFQSYSANRKIGAGHLQPVRQKLLSAIKKEECRIVNRYWEATPAPIVDAAQENFTRFILDPGDKDTVLARMDSIAQSCWAHIRRIDGK